jgi:sugar lactone lactonase YvrE
MAEFKVLLDGLIFTEGPRWHDGKLYFSDMHAHKVMSVDLAGKAQTVAEVPTWPSGLGWLPDGRMLIVSMTDRKVLRQDPDGLKTHADLSKLASFHCNDMVTDGKGRCYVGNLGYDLLNDAPKKPAEIVLVNPDGTARVAAADLDFPNGTVITPDGKTLVGHQLSAFDIQSDGALTRMGESG